MHLDPLARLPEAVGSWAASRLGTLVSLTGSAATTTGGVLMAAAPAGSTQGNVGIGVAICGMVSVLAPLVFKDRADERQYAVKELRRQNAELRAEVARLGGAVSEVPINTARIAATEGRAEAIEEALRARGWLAPDPGPRLPSLGPRRTILIVEDDPATAKVLMRLFVREGFAATYAASLEEAGRLLAFGPHILILDLLLQGGDGLILLRQVRDAGLACRVIVVTAAVDPLRLAAVRELKPDALLQKPVRLDDLMAAVDAPPSSSPIPAPEAPP